MSARSYFRGHPIIRLFGRWVYEDNGASLPADGGDTRPCARCGQQTPLGEGEVDPCLGALPGVDNACCGHGVPSEAYIRFTNGVVVRGFTVEYGEATEPE
ncbi:hypothetical protein LCGC14_0259460 [marine sediment metagenome]|uniref:Uncharacterized protein n=1 Tax=marine sediment metagenome TaxID=412755 RepID=A0A0F9WMY8_9ZZZZ